MKYFSCVIIFLFSVSLPAQHVIGFEAQAYPAGLVPGVRMDIELPRTSHFILRAGYNFTNRRNWGKHDKEEGGGPGFGLGYQFRGLFADGLNMQIRSDFWFMDIDWTELRTICPFMSPCFEDEISSTTNITVFQPTVGITYDLWQNQHLLLRSSLSLGYEINIRTQGEDVGEGAILLGGIDLGYRF